MAHEQKQSGEAEEFWEEHYQQRQRVFSGCGNRVFAEVASALAPRRALDLGRRTRHC